MQFQMKNVAQYSLLTFKYTLFTIQSLFRSVYVFTAKCIDIKWLLLLCVNTAAWYQQMGGQGPLMTILRLEIFSRLPINIEMYIVK